MMFHRPGRLRAVLFCFAVISNAAFLSAQSPAGQQPPPAKQNPQQPPPAQPTKPEQTPPKKPNPFENVPQTPAQPEAPKPQQPPIQNVTPKPEAPPAVQQAQPGQPPEDIIEGFEFRGARRVRQDTLQALIASKKGDRYDEEILHRDFMALWNTGRFDDIRIEREAGKTGWIIRFVLVERPVVRSIKYEGNKSVTVSEILDRYKERKVGLVVESQYDPNKVQRAKNVLLELLAERGHQYAKVDPEIRRVPPSSLEITFKVNEGPKVKVGKIEVAGNAAFSNRAVIRAMKNSHPIGLPHSILFENLFARTYDSTKLEEDKQRIQVFYQEHGYFTAHVTDANVTMRKVGGEGLHIWLIHPNKVGTRADIAVTLEEGRKYRLNNITFTGVKFFRTPEALMTPLFQMSKGDVFTTAKLKKGLEQLRKLYGDFGFINFVAEPDPVPLPNSDLVDLSLSVDEGHQFFVRRIDFAGNTTTRDKVIRRELLIDEGQIFNNRMWELSILRLNQLGYFDPLKAEEAADIKTDTKTNTVDLTLKVKERGKNSIQLNGGVSGIAGSFIGFSYATNNFLGLGETLSLSSQLGTRIRQVQFGFTEPYLFDKPIQTGFTLYTQRFNYDQGREASILSGQNLIPLFNSLGQGNLLNYVSNGYGGTVFVSYPLKRSFARLGLTYGYDISSIRTLTNSASQYFNFIDFQGVGGPNQLSGIRTSKIIPSYTYNSVNHPITPTGGKSIFFSMAYAGVGGNVNTIEPTLDAKYFRSGFKRGHVIGMHLLARFLTGYGGKVAPPFSRYYTGGENDIRGFDIWGISPIVFLPSSANVNVLNVDGTQRVQKQIVGGQTTFSNVTMQIPTYQLTFPGGDTNVVTNFEYRIPIFGPVVLAAFGDAGIDKLTLPGQLKLNPGRIDQLNSQFPQAGFSGRAYIAPGTQKIRTSTGLELQVLMPVVNAPFRLYWAYNPTVFRGFLQAPIVANRSDFPNTATYVNAIVSVGQPIPFFEKHSQFRFSIGRTF
ncbi:MAG TPA: outer membrane protein assembly factor BamA [Bryobacteraceae bacterium]|nr:outer membrane protein assembly factor BamA [Bryobacteraceae bacterium]